MQGITSKHPPGAVMMVTGDITRYAVSMQSLTSLVAPAGSVLAWHTGVLIAKSINDAFEVIMKNPALQWGWIMGDDHTFAPDTLMKMLDANVEMSVPLCVSRLPPMDPTIINHTHHRNRYLSELPQSGLYRLAEDETCGDAGLLIRRSAIERLGPPWYDNRVSGAHAAEDQTFIQKAKDAGFDIHVNMDVAIGHVGHVNFIPVRKPDTGEWNVRLMGGGARHIIDLTPMGRAPVLKPEFKDAAE